MTELADVGGAIAGREDDLLNHRREVIVAEVVLAFGLVAFLVFAVGQGVRDLGLVGALAVFALVFVPYPALSVDRWRGRLAAWIAEAPVLRVGILLLLPLAAYAAYSGIANTFDGRFVWQYVLYVGVPAGLMLSGVRAGREDPFAMPLRFLAAVLVLWLPVDLGWLTEFGIPTGAERTVDVTQLIGLDVGLLLFTVVTPVRDLGYCFRLRLSDLRLALLALAAVAVVVIPLGLAIGFIRYGWQDLQPLAWALIAFNIYFVVAIPEEFLFRGLLQNLFEKRWRGGSGRVGSLIVASLIFGAAHVNNPPFPNFRYVALATLAGLAYGWVWMWTRKVTASAVTHAAVDWIWVVAFRG
ncbi:MAG: type II CAAX endopeptidase family protein [Gemmatimonadales bacterium]|jgi:membrane protease YdiL (CAAX protease family)